MKMKLEELVSPEASPALGPYCHGRKYGDMIITSGQIPLTKDGEYVFEDVYKRQLQRSLTRDIIRRKKSVF